MSSTCGHPAHRRRARPIRAVVGLLVLSLPFFPEAAQAQSVDDQQAEVERIVDELDRLHERADILAEDYAVAMDDQRRLNGDIDLARGRVALRQAELAELQGDLSTVAVRAFTRSGTDVLGPLLSNASAYSDDLTRDQLSRVALKVGAGTTDDLGEAIRALELEQIDLNRLLGESEVLAESISGMIDEVEGATASYEKARVDAEAKLGRLIAAEEQRRSQLAFERLQRQLAAEQAASGGASYSGAAAEDSQSSSFAANYPAPSGLAGVAIQAALGQLGVPYVYATASPGVSFDCSGLTYYAWAQAGVSLPRNSRMQANAVPRVPIAAAQPGDLLFYYSPISHVGIYLGNGQLVHSPNSSTHVKVSNVNWAKVVVVGRPG